MRKNRRMVQIIKIKMKKRGKKKELEANLKGKLE